MIRQTLAIATLLVLCLTTKGQIRIGVDAGPQDSSAMLEISSTVSGFIPPRLSSVQRNEIPSPAKGLIIFNVSTGSYNYFDGTEWRETEHVTSGISPGNVTSGKGVIISDSENSTCDSSAILHVSSSSRGLLIPRTTPSSIISPGEGLLIYDLSTNRLAFYTGTGWIELCSKPAGAFGMSGTGTIAGIAISEDGTQPDHSAVLDVQSETKGVLLPRMTSAERDQVKAVPGLTIYNITDKELQYSSGSGWEKIEHTVSAGIAISAGPSEEVCNSQSSSVIFTATVTNGGNNPVFQWFLNGNLQPDSGSTASFPVSDGDVIKCIMQSDDPCASEDDAVSNEIIMKIFPVPGTSSIIFN